MCQTRRRVRSLLPVSEELAYRSAVQKAPVICVFEKRRERDGCKAYKKAESAVCLAQMRNSAFRSITQQTRVICVFLKNAEKRADFRRTRKFPPQFTLVNEEGIYRSATPKTPLLCVFYAPWQCLYFFPEPQGQGSLGRTFFSTCTGIGRLFSP